MVFPRASQGVCNVFARSLRSICFARYFAKCFAMFLQGARKVCARSVQGVCKVLARCLQGC